MVKWFIGRMKLSCCNVQWSLLEMETDRVRRGIINHKRAPTGQGFA